MLKLVEKPIGRDFLLALIKRHLIFSSIIFFICIFLFGFELPEIFLEQQIKYQTQEILNRNDFYRYCTDKASKTYLKQHPHLKLIDVSDEQGQTDKLSYHLGTTSTNIGLGINVYHYSNLPYSKIKIDSIKVWIHPQK